MSPAPLRPGADGDMVHTHILYLVDGNGHPSGWFELGRVCILMNDQPLRRGVIAIPIHAPERGEGA